MDIKDIISVVAGSLSALVAVYAAIVAKTAVRNQSHIEKWTVNHDLLSRASSMVVDNPDLLWLHGVDIDDLSNDHISKQELVYIYLHFDAGSALHRIGSDEIVELSPYCSATINLSPREGFDFRTIRPQNRDWRAPLDSRRTPLANPRRSF